MTLSIKFWGTRGSIPAPPSAAAEREKLARVLASAEPSDIADRAAIEAFIDSGCRGALPTRYGGNTSCVEVRAADGARLLFDLGSGARVFATELAAAHGPVLKEPLNILLSHLHWDHIQGFPFFVPAYVPGNQLRIHGCHPDIEGALQRQQSDPFFPVPFAVLGADISTHTLEPGETVEISGFQVTPFALMHGGGAYAYRIERDGVSVVYATDGEHKPETVHPESPYVEFIKDADVLIFDAQYSLAESISIKEDWGHSSNVVGVELALHARVRRLVFFHHDPLTADYDIDEMVESSRQFEQIMRGERPNLTISAAWDGLEMEV